MAITKIGNRSETFFIEKANTTYVLERGKTVDLGSDSFALYMDDELKGVDFQLDGKVKATATGIYVSTEKLSSAVTLDIGSTGSVAAGVAMRIMGDGHLIRNAGHVTGSDVGSGVSAHGAVTIVNSGEIKAGQALDLTGLADDVTIVKNSGTLWGTSEAIQGGIETDMVTNTGKIRGDVHLADGGDTFVFKSGVVNGVVYGEAGDDTYILRRAGLEISESSGMGTGYDTVKASISFTLPDNVEDLKLLGRGDINGFGNAGGNELVGNGGRNALFGYAGNDILNGGRGNDVLSGGAGADDFHFNLGSGTDYVADFEAGIDQIYLGSLKGAAGYDDMLANHVTEKSGDLWITYGDDTVILTDVQKKDLHSSDFDFG